jgi:hypothetical protein
VQIPSKLKSYLASRECVAFVGAGFSAPCGMPGWGGLLDLLLSAARESAGDSDPQQIDLIDACHSEVSAGRYLTASIGVRIALSSQELSRLLSEAFSLDRLKRLPEREQKRMLERMENLVLGPWSGIITTNYDTLIESGIDRFCRTGAPLRANGEQASLGHVLCVSSGTPNFFVKLHGEAWADTPVLCSDDYIRAWQTSPRIRHFMTATMLRYRIVFLGCSLEDEILRLRQTLWAAFNRALPRCYALLPNTAQNRIRGRSLIEDAGIELIPYEISSDGDGHMDVDSFLRQARQCAETLHSDSLGNTFSAVSKMNGSQKLLQIGEINRSLLRIHRAQPNRRLEDKYLYSPLWESLDLSGEQSTMRACTEGERVYRVLYLVSIGLLREVTITKQHFFEIPSSVADDLAACPPRDE